MSSGERPSAILLLAVALCLPGCGDRAGKVELAGREGVYKSTASVRADRRAYDGAPPTIPHDDFGIDCDSCHNRDGVAVPDVGFAPPTPHGSTDGLSAVSRCRQCHVFRTTERQLVPSGFVGLRQDLRRGPRMHANAPPTIPHKVFMRENCGACHGGAAAREEIRTPHPERTRCRQCHVPVAATGSFHFEETPG